MKTVTVSEAESGIARLLGLVRKGETVVIVSRGKPVAEIHPVRAEAPAAVPDTDPEWEHLVRLEREGKIRLPKSRTQDWSWLKEARERHPSSIGLAEAIIDEREEGR